MAAISSAQAPAIDWLKKGGERGWDLGQDIAVDAQERAIAVKDDGTCYFSGGYEGDADFDDLHRGHSNGGFDFFLAKMATSAPVEKDAWWTEELDTDYDEYKSSARLNCKVDLVGAAGSETVVVSVSRKPVSGTSWTVVATRSKAMALPGRYEGNVLIEGANHDGYDFKISFFRQNGTLITTLGKTEDMDLFKYLMETAAEEEILFFDFNDGSGQDWRSRVLPFDFNDITFTWDDYINHPVFPYDPVQNTLDTGAGKQSAPGIDAGILMPEGNSASNKIPFGLSPAMDIADVSIGYYIYRSTNPGGPYTQIASNITRQYYRDEPLENGRTYYYVITAVYAEHAQNLAGIQLECASMNDEKITSLSPGELLENTGRIVRVLGPTKLNNGKRWQVGIYSYGKNHGACGSGMIARFKIADDQLPG